jgi:MFS transporter (putative signal transducer)
MNHFRLFYREHFFTEQRKKDLFFFFLYSLQGLPIYFFTLTLPTILRSLGYPLSFISSLGLLGIPWALKFLWAPLIDHFGNRKFGRRKSWLFPLQCFLALLFFILIFLPPAQSGTQQQSFFLSWPILSFLIVLSSATQDTALDALMMDCLSQEERGRGNAWASAGSAVGVLCGGTLGLYFFEYWGWSVAMFLLAVLHLCGLFVMMKFPETEYVLQKDFSHRAPMKSLFVDCSKKFTDFFTRKGMIPFLFFVLLFRSSEALMMGIQSSFLVDQHFTLTEIGSYLGFWGAVGGLISAYLAGQYLKKQTPLVFLMKIALMKCALYVLMTYLTLNHQAEYKNIYFVLIQSHIYLRYMILVALYTQFMKYCVKNQQATDFSLLASLDLLVYIALVSVSGFFVQQFGYSSLFALQTLLALTSILTFSFMVKRFPS